MLNEKLNYDSYKLFNTTLIYSNLEGNEMKLKIKTDKMK